MKKPDITFLFENLNDPLLPFRLAMQRFHANKDKLSPGDLTGLRDEINSTSRGPMSSKQTQELEEMIRPLKEALEQNGAASKKSPKAEKVKPAGKPKTASSAVPPSAPTPSAEEVKPDFVQTPKKAKSKLSANTETKVETPKAETPKEEPKVKPSKPKTPKAEAPKTTPTEDVKYTFNGETVDSAAPEKESKPSGRSTKREDPNQKLKDDFTKNKIEFEAEKLADERAAYAKAKAPSWASKVVKSFAKPIAKTTLALGLGAAAAGSSYVVTSTSDKVADTVGVKDEIIRSGARNTADAAITGTLITKLGTGMSWKEAALSRPNLALTTGIAAYKTGQWAGENLKNPMTGKTLNTHAGDWGRKVMAADDPAKSVQQAEADIKPVADTLRVKQAGNLAAGEFTTAARNAIPSGYDEPRIDHIVGDIVPSMWHSLKQFAGWTPETEEYKDYSARTREKMDSVIKAGAENARKVTERQYAKNNPNNLGYTKTETIKQNVAPAVISSPTKEPTAWRDLKIDKYYKGNK